MPWICGGPYSASTSCRFSCSSWLV